MDQSHIISNLTIITLVYENDAYGWRIFAIGGKEDNYKENISIWELFKRIIVQKKSKIKICIGMFVTFSEKEY